MKRQVYLDMKSLEEAREIFWSRLGHGKRTAPETIRTEETLGRITAEPEVLGAVRDRVLRAEVGRVGRVAAIVDVDRRVTERLQDGLQQLAGLDDGNLDGARTGRRVLVDVLGDGGLVDQPVRALRHASAAAAAERCRLVLERRTDVCRILAGTLGDAAGLILVDVDDLRLAGGGDGKAARHASDGV